MFELPAGTGKTERISESVAALAAQGGKTLVLTHTNAGVSALRCRLSRNGVNRSSYSIYTVCAFAEQFARPYPMTAGLDLRLNLFDSGYYDGLVDGAARLLSNDYFREVIGRSFSALIVDEYQDCDLSQHQLIMALSQCVERSFVFGDRMQRIYDFGGAVFPTWSDVCNFFPPLDVGKVFPYRWAGKNDELGQWLTFGVRPGLLEGRPVDFASLPKGCALIGKSRSDLDSAVVRLAYSMQVENETSLVLCGSANRTERVNLAKRTNGAYQNIEDVEGKAMHKWLDAFPDGGSGHEKALWLAHFAKECFSGISKGGLDRTVLNAIRDGKKLERYCCGSRSDFSNALIALQRYADLPCIATYKAACRAIELSPCSKLVLGEEWSCVNASIEESSLSGGAVSPKEALRKLRSSFRYSGIVSKRSVGTTLLVKGLEFDNVLVRDFGELKKKEDQYVALTRGSRRLAIVEARG